MSHIINPSIRMLNYQVNHFFVEHDTSWTHFSVTWVPYQIFLQKKFFLFISSCNIELTGGRVNGITICCTSEFKFKKIGTKLLYAQNWVGGKSNQLKNIVEEERCSLPHRTQKSYDFAAEKCERKTKLRRKQKSISFPPPPILTGIQQALIALLKPQLFFNSHFQFSLLDLNHRLQFSENGLASHTLHNSIINGV